MSDIDIKRLESIGIGYILVEVNDHVFWDFPIGGCNRQGEGIEWVTGDEVILYADG